MSEGTPKIIVMGMHEPTLRKWNWRASLGKDLIWGLAHHDWTMAYGTAAFESHSEPIVRKHGGEPHVRRLRELANMMPLYTPWEWSEKLGPNHIVEPHRNFAHISPYFESSIAFVMVKAIDHILNVRGPEKSIGVYGVNMSAEDEYAYQRPNMQYLIGYARGLGIPVHIPGNCELFSSQWKGKLYGSPADVDSMEYRLQPASLKYYEQEE